MGRLSSLFGMVQPGSTGRSSLRLEKFETGIKDIDGISGVALQALQYVFISTWELE